MTSWIGSIILIVLWFAPVVFIGALSNVVTRCEQVSYVSSYSFTHSAAHSLTGGFAGYAMP